MAVAARATKMPMCTRLVPMSGNRSPTGSAAVAGWPEPCLSFHGS